MSGEHWDIKQVADHWGVKTSSARGTLSRLGIKGVTMYPADQILNAHRPGKGARTDLKERNMSDENATTDYGTWSNLTGGGSARLEDSVADYLGEYGDEYDVDAICDEYRDAVNNILPDRVALVGNDLYGPYATRNEFDWEEISEELETIDLAAIVDRHEITGSQETA